MSADRHPDDGKPSYLRMALAWQKFEIKRLTAANAALKSELGRQGACGHWQKDQMALVEKVAVLEAALTTERKEQMTISTEDLGIITSTNWIAPDGLAFSSELECKKYVLEQKIRYIFTSHVKIPGESVDLILFNRDLLEMLKEWHKLHPECAEGEVK